MKETLKSKDADFSNDSLLLPTTIEGFGQTGYWRGCSVIVYKASDKARPIDDYGTCDEEPTGYPALNYDTCDALH